MPVSKGFNAQPGRHGRSPETENPAQWAASLSAKKEAAVPPDYALLMELLAALPRDRSPTLAELVELRQAVPPTPADVVRASLADRFLLPPFSVLDARQGYWQKRKKMWLELGIQSELGRGETPSTADNGLLGFSEQARGHYRTNATPTGRPFPTCQAEPDGQGEKYARGDGRGRPLARKHYRSNAPGGSAAPAIHAYDGQTTTGSYDGRRPLARTKGSGGPGDLAAGFRTKGAHPIPGGGTGKNSAYLFKGPDGYKSLKELQEGETASLDGGLTLGTTIHPYDGSSSQVQSGTSIFDPVLCEIAYRWFCRAGGRVLDPFAGGSVRGIVAAQLGRVYAGVDLRPEQAEANYVQAEMLCPDADLTWAVGDSVGIADLLPGEYDLVFSCPPYADLERYSDDPRDLSTMPYDKFLEVYRAIIAASCAMLKPDRFAVWVVGDVRGKDGNYRGFVGDTVEAFRAAGLELYNEAVLVTAVGSLPIRVGRQFDVYRKLGKTHQNVLIFLKGDAGRAAAACGKVDVDDLEMPGCEVGRVAICGHDVVGAVGVECLDDIGNDVAVVQLPQTEAFLFADIMCGQARASGKQTPRMWVGTEAGWQRVEDGVELIYLVGGVPYLNRAVFPEAKGPTSAAPQPKRMR